MLQPPPKGLRIAAGGSSGGGGAGGEAKGGVNVEGCLKVGVGINSWP